jgi:universal stress protein family protein
MTSRFPAVVAGVGTGVEGAAAARAAVAEARRRLLPVRLVRAFSWDAAPGGRASGAPGQEAARRAAARSLEDLRDSLLPDLPSGQLTAVLREGAATEILLDEAGSAELVVLGAHGTGTAATVLGEARATLLRRARCPLLFLSPVAARQATPGPVVVGVDGGPGTRQLLSTAVLEAATRSAELVVVHSARHEDEQQGAGSLPTALRTEVQLLQQGHPGVHVRLETPADPPGTALEIAGRGAQLLVVGRSGRPFDAVGQILRQVVTGAATDVLVVPLTPVPGTGPIRTLASPAAPATTRFPAVDRGRG